MTKPIIDLHCDLLFYLELDSKRTPYDLAPRCGISQLRNGNVILQTMAIFTETRPSSSDKGMEQLKIYQGLPLHYPKDFQHYSPEWDLQSPRIATLMAFENASGFCSEQESLQEGFDRLKKAMKFAKPLYISLTWNTENRFGGGALTKIGLKEDGKRLLEEIDRQGIAVDLSHASDALANEAIDYIAGHNLHIPLMASHSNARAVSAVPRNLPDDLAGEIFRRRGIVGFNLYRYFIGDHPEDVVKHFAHWLELGGENHMAFGADLFNDADLPPTYKHGKEGFFQEYQNAGCYGSLLTLLEKELGLTNALMDKLSHQNALAFINRSWLGLS